MGNCQSQNCGCSSSQSKEGPPQATDGSVSRESTASEVPNNTPVEQLSPFHTPPNGEITEAAIEQPVLTAQDTAAPAALAPSVTVTATAAADTPTQEPKEKKNPWYKKLLSKLKTKKREEPEDFLETILKYKFPPGIFCAGCGHEFIQRQCFCDPYCGICGHLLSHKEREDMFMAWCRENFEMIKAETAVGK